MNKELCYFYTHSIPFEKGDEKIFFGVFVLSSIRKELKKHASPARAKITAGFFKTGKGEYAEKDIFIGITVPDTRKIAKKYNDLDQKSLTGLLHSPLHEERLCALLILVHRFEKARTEKERKSLAHFYLKEKKWVNNWDLVDLSARQILGNYLLDKDRAVLKKLAASKNLWDRRIAIVSTYAFIREGDFVWTFALSKKLMQDKEDLMHKACGWMLREVGKRNKEALVQFLKTHEQQMPRTMLRYARERL